MENIISSEVPVFHPTYEEFVDFKRYMQSIEHLARDIGICKIVPPKEWRSKQPNFLSLLNQLESNKEFSLNSEELEAKRLIDKVLITKPLAQTFEGKNGCYDQLNMECRKKFTISGFKHFAESPQQKTPNIKIDKEADPLAYYAQLESLYWKSLPFSKTFYGADLSGTLFDESFSEWNVAKLDNLLSDLPLRIPGVNSSYLYFGMWRATFAWHVEDLDLFSINYLHFGEPKQWFCIPPKYSKKFEQVAKSHFTDGFKSCPQYLRHKTSVLSPKILSKADVPVVKMLQKEGEIMITFPYGYHAGFNYGFNCAESVNFAFENWLEIGVHAEYCVCNGDSVKIDLENVFRSEFQKVKLSYAAHSKDQNINKDMLYLQFI